MNPKVTICLLTYGDYPALARRAIDSIRRHCPREQYELSVGANAVSGDTREYLGAQKEAGIIDRLVESDTNLNKCPMMRLLLQNVRTEFIWWFDDDSYFIDSSAFDRWFKAAVEAPDSTVMWGNLAFCDDPAAFAPEQDDAVRFVRSARWYRGLPPPTWRPGGKGEMDFEGRGTGDGRWYFVLGGCWLIRTAAIEAIDWPDSRLVKMGDDVFLGEAIRQQGWSFQSVGNPGVAIDTEPRRGDPGYTAKNPGRTGFSLVRPAISIVVAITTALAALTSPIAAAASAEAREEQECIDNMKFIYDALESYRAENRKFPDNLAQLTPAWIRDEEILVCPLVRNRGGLRAWGFVRDPSFDPHTSYVYEIATNRVHSMLWRGYPPKTSGEYKERQRQKLGPSLGGKVPIVRCHHHARSGRDLHLNLGFDGQVYQSRLNWEELFTNKVSWLDLAAPGRLFLDLEAARKPGPADFASRDPRAPPNLIDLTTFYNGRLMGGWQGFPENDLAKMPSGIHEFAGVKFDVRGVIQLDGIESTLDFPRAVQGIPVHRKFRRIHCLHGATFWTNPSLQIGAYFLCYADGEFVELPIVYGQEVADWWNEKGDWQDLSNGTIAWAGSNRAAEAMGATIRIYRSTWDNPRPDLEVTSIDFVSRVEFAAPFLLGITVEP